MVERQLIRVEGFDLRVLGNREFPVGSYTQAAIQFSNPDSVTWSTAVVTLERSVDGLNWVALATPVTITAVGVTDVDVSGFPFLRLRVSAAESGSGEVRFDMFLTDAVSAS